MTTIEPPVFPAHAGMSPHVTPLRTELRGFPRPRGDEPEPRPAPAHGAPFSPPTRG